ncbi:MAG: hypothetical protein HXY50_08570 [Ignavibacteriaceae bacterium]|nr:hypothetical protein [Ignavibacteriaceae bacterium]
MKKYLAVFISLAFFYTNAQTKIIFTAIDYSRDEVRAAVCDSDGNNRTELGFNKTYLPIWFGNKILLNSDSFIWQCDSSGQNLQKLFPGYRSTVSTNKKLFAFYDSNGIAVADENGRIIKQIAVNVFEDASITWSNDDKKISFFDPDKKRCFLFSLENDSLEIFGDLVFHPLWNPKNEIILFNKALTDGKYAVIVKLKNGEEEIINQQNENAVVPIWSHSGTKIAYLSFTTLIENSPESDLYPCDLVIYDFEKKKHQVLSSEASFTDKAFPQMCFDEKDEFLYFTKINDNNLGSLARVNLVTWQVEIISKDSFIDERFPQVKTFK